MARLGTQAAHYAVDVARQLFNKEWLYIALRSSQRSRQRKALFFVIGILAITFFAPSPKYLFILCFLLL